ncbi:hypothetical protein [Cellulomonas sp. HZM]|uniref:hypothetical protein n=1 Tax=Cellulomonas sp. HZM TaxID=1454010 RepID=UPI000557AF82|nr:hypothetical protein [Cellulomonas sp. HZM]
MASSFGWAGAAHADPVRTCSSSQTGWWWETFSTNKSRTPVLTHNTGLHLAPATTYSKTLSLEHTTTVKASVSTSVSVSEDLGNAVLGKVESKYSLTLAADKATTKKSAESVKVSIAKRPKDAYYAAYDGVVLYKGTWGMDRCSGGVVRHFSGKWQSFVNVTASNAECKYDKKTRKSAYSKGSLAYLACDAIGWGNDI